MSEEARKFLISKGYVEEDQYTTFDRYDFPIDTDISEIMEEYFKYKFSKLLEDGQKCSDGDIIHYGNSEPFSEILITQNGKEVFVSDFEAERLSTKPEEIAIKKGVPKDMSNVTILRIGDKNGTFYRWNDGSS